MKAWKALSRRTKLVAGSGVLLFGCILCSLVGSLFGESNNKISHEDLVQTQVVNLQISAQLTEQTTIAEISITATPELPSPTSTEVDVPDLVIDACILAQDYEIGNVTEIVDGDTIRVQIGDQNYSVRYIGIDAPDDPGSAPSSALNTELVAGKQIYLLRDTSDVDSFGRLLRYVYANGIFVNNELVRRGYAIAISYPPDTSCDSVFSNAQSEAENNQLGIWMPTPTVPSVSAEAILTIISVNKEAEYVDIQNTGGQSQNLSGWVLVSERGNQTCPLSGTIGPGETITVWAMTSSGGSFNCGYNTNIWNNSESDPAVLYNPQGVQVSRYP